MTEISRLSLHRHILRLGAARVFEAHTLEDRPSAEGGGGKNVPDSKAAAGRLIRGRDTTWRIEYSRA